MTNKAFPCFRQVLVTTVNPDNNDSVNRNSEEKNKDHQDVIAQPFRTQATHTCLFSQGLLQLLLRLRVGTINYYL